MSRWSNAHNTYVVDMEDTTIVELLKLVLFAGYS